MKDKKAFLEKNKVYKDGNLDLEKFDSLDTKLQTDILKEILGDLYTGTKEIDLDNKYILKCLSLACSKEDEEVHLPNGLLVSKVNNKISFAFHKNVAKWFIIAFVAALIFVSIGATYSALNYLKLAKLNVDIDGDGIPELNLDINDDETAEINIDLDGDNKPDVNIDYKSNREEIFNVVKGDTTLNPINVMGTVDGKEVCVRNCDTNDDGWPDVNLDLDGDGEAETDIDTNNDNTPDLNIDNNGDKVCDLQCDNDGDGICNDTTCSEDDENCDKFCVVSWSNIIITKNGTTEIVGNAKTTNSSAKLEVVYQDKSNVVINDILPDDMTEAKSIPTKKFTVQNLSPYYVKYSLEWVNLTNEYVSNNFKYSLTCEPNCKSFDFVTVPKSNGIFLTDIYIAPGATQSYVVTFKLQGTNAPQNEDKGRLFTGKIQVTYEGTD